MGLQLSMIQIDPRTLAEAAGTAAVVGLAAARHMPAPSALSVAYAWIFDTVQDLAKNNDRIGEKRSIPNVPAAQPQKAEQ